MKNYRSATERKDCNNSELEMMSLNNNVGAPAIFYLYATSTAIVVLVTLGAVATTATATATASTVPIAEATASAEAVTSTVSPVTVIVASIAPWHTAANASPNMHNSTEMQANALTNEEKSNNLNHFEKNNRNDSIMALSPSLSTPSRDWNNGNQQHSNNEQQSHQQHQRQRHHHSDQHSFEMENSRKYLHLDEHNNFVATTPKIQTTKLPNRYAQHSFNSFQLLSFFLNAPKTIMRCYIFYFSVGRTAHCTHAQCAVCE